MTANTPGPAPVVTDRDLMAILLPHVEADPAALLEYARLWMRLLYTGSPQFKKPKEPGTGPWVTRLLIEALTAQLEEQGRLREAAAAILAEFDGNRLRPVATFAEQDRMKATREVVNNLRAAL